MARSGSEGLAVPLVGGSFAVVPVDFSYAGMAGRTHRWGTWCSEHPWNRSWRHVQAVGDNETVSSILPVILQEPLHHAGDP